MIIAVDARQIFRAHRRGAGKSLVDLYRTLAKDRPTWQIEMFHHQDTIDHPFPDIANIHLHRVTCPIPGEYRFNLWENAVFPGQSLLKRASLLHSPFNTGPKFNLAPLVVTVHDLIPLETRPDHPETVAWVNNVRHAVRAARHVMTPSEYSKSRIVETFGTAPDKITVIPWAPDRTLTRVIDPAVLARYGLKPDEGYIFSFGAIDPRKNTRGLIEAYAQLPTELRASYRLILVGVDEPARTEYASLAEQLGVGQQVAIFSYITQADVPTLISGATVLAFPSFTEGFGLPILDAFVCETAVLTSNRTSLPETAGDAAELIDPGSIDSIRQGLYNLLTEPDLRRTLIRRGCERRQLFSWERVAAQVAEVFSRIAG